MTMLKKSLLSVTAVAVMTGIVGCSDGGETVTPPVLQEKTFSVVDGTVSIKDGAYVASAKATKGDNFALKANAPAEGFVFSAWTGTDVATLLDSNVATTTGSMINKDVALTATYEATGTGSSSILLDNFEINKFGTAGVGDEVYSAQSYLGYQLGGFVDQDNDSLSKGGGFWYSYASGNGVSIFNADSTTVVIGGAETAPASGQSNTLMAGLLGDNTMSFVIDYRTLDAGTEGSSWGGVGVAIAGDAAHLPATTGATVYTYTPSWTGATETKSITWNLTNLKSIAFTGKVQGPAQINLKGMLASGTANEELTINFETHGDITPSTSALVPFDFTVNVADLANWDNIKERVEGLEIQLVSDDADGTASNYLLMQMDDITLNFDNETQKFEAFPFLNITQ